MKIPGCREGMIVFSESEERGHDSGKEITLPESGKDVYLL